MTREAVGFANRHGDRLVGILERPIRDDRHDVAVLLLSPGVKMRVGPQRLYTRISKQLVELGLPVLRFDFYGLGDSEGTVAEDLLRDVYNHIEVGRFINDTVDAMNWMQGEFGINRFILSGLCGGAVTGLLAAAKDARVVGLLGLGITPVLASQAANPALYMTDGELTLIRRTYFSKLLRPSAWLRLLTMQADLTLLWRAISQPVRKAARATTSTDAPPADNSNPLFPISFFSVAESGRPILLVFGGADRLQWEFDEKFASRYRDRLASCKNQWDVHVVADANHTLSFPEWQDEMLAVASRWIASRFPALQPQGR